MLSAAQGGLEQSLIDYCEALQFGGHRPLAVVHPHWPGRSQLTELSVEQATIRSLNEWDPMAPARLRRLLKTVAPSIVLTIGRRASRLGQRALRRLPGPRQVVQTPNYSLEHLIGLDLVIATTDGLRQALIEAGQPAAKVTVIPNLVRVPPAPPRLRGEVSTRPVIGALGRMVPKKGFANLISALAQLRDRGYRFRAKLGGSGPEEGALRRLAATHHLTDQIEFLGWVHDTAAFFEQLDVFCVPSLHEPFGVVVLEGLAHARATVVTDTEGPSEIVTDRVDGLIVPKGAPTQLADALAELLDDIGLRRALAKAGHATARARYDLPVVAKQISAALGQVVGWMTPSRSPGVLIRSHEKLPEVPSRRCRLPSKSHLAI